MIGNSVSMSRSIPSARASKIPKARQPLKAGRVSQFDQMVWLNAGNNTTAMTSPIPVPVNKRRVLLGS